MINTRTSAELQAISNTYHPSTCILIEGLKLLPGGSVVLAEWDRVRKIYDDELIKNLVQ
jgi:molybdopterin-guanine dinucleotide biosynthesis protein